MSGLLIMKPAAGGASHVMLVFETCEQHCSLRRNWLYQDLENESGALAAAKISFTPNMPNGIRYGLDDYPHSQGHVMGDIPSDTNDK